MDETAFRDMKLNHNAARQIRDVAALTPPALTEAQQFRLARQQRFRQAFATLDALLTDITEFSVAHHYFKESTKQRWVALLFDAIEGMRPFLPKDPPRSANETL